MSKIFLLVLVIAYAFYELRIVFHNLNLFAYNNIKQKKKFKKWSARYEIK